MMRISSKKYELALPWQQPQQMWLVWTLLRHLSWMVNNNNIQLHPMSALLEAILPTACWSTIEVCTNGIRCCKILKSKPSMQISSFSLEFPNYSKSSKHDFYGPTDHGKDLTYIMVSKGNGDFY